MVVELMEKRQIHRKAEIKPRELALGKYRVARSGVLIIDTDEGCFSPLDLENGRMVKMTQALVDKRRQFRENSPSF